MNEKALQDFIEWCEEEIKKSKRIADSIEFEDSRYGYLRNGQFIDTSHETQMRNRDIQENIAALIEQVKNQSSIKNN